MQPTSGAIRQIKGNAKRVMIGTEIVETAQNEHPGLEGFRLTSQGPRATSQRSQPLTKGGIEAFDIGGVDAALSLRALDERLDQLSRPLDNAPSDGSTTWATLFDYLNDADVRPPVQPTSPSFALPWHLETKPLLEGSDITGQPINGQKQGTTQDHG